MIFFFSILILFLYFRASAGVIKTLLGHKKCKRTVWKKYVTRVLSATWDYYYVTKENISLIFLIRWSDWNTIISLFHNKLHYGENRVEISMFHLVSLYFIISLLNVVMLVSFWTFLEGNSNELKLKWVNSLLNSQRWIQILYITDVQYTTFKNDQKWQQRHFNITFYTNILKNYFQLW